MFDHPALHPGSPLADLRDDATLAALYDELQSLLLLGDMLAACERMVVLMEALIARTRISAAVRCLGLALDAIESLGTPTQDEHKRTFAALVLRLTDVSMYLTKEHQRLCDLVMKARSLATGMGDARTNVLLTLALACLENMSAQCSPVQLCTLQAQCAECLEQLNDKELQASLANVQGMLAFWRGDFKQVLTAFEQAQTTPQTWHSRFHTELFHLYTSSAALYLGRFYQAVGILQAAHAQAVKARQPFIELWWQAQLAAVLLYMNKDDEALTRIDHVITHADPVNETKIYVWALRALAFYHYKRGDVRASHTIMCSSLETVHKNGFKRLTYSYPWMLEMLYAYRAAGLPDLPGCGFDDEMQRALQGPNTHLKAAAFKMQGIMALAKNDPARLPQAVQQIKRCLSLFEEVGNPLETAKAQALLSHAFARQGRNGLARQLTTLAEQLQRRFRHFDCTPTHAPGLQGETFAPAPANPAVPEQPHADLAEQCKTLFDDSAFTDDLPQALMRYTRIASHVLGAEKVLLFALDHAEDLVCKAVCHADAEEVCRITIKQTLLGMRAEKARNPRLMKDGNGDALLCLLEPANGETWGLYAVSSFTSEHLKTIPEAVLRDVYTLLAYELRTLLRLYAMHAATQGAGAPLTPIFMAKQEDVLCQSQRMRTLMAQAEQSALTDAPMLIQGETGVGKEVLANHVHRQSERQGAFVVVHPASIPEPLFESEFFGHEKGSFTGAHKQKIGFVEMAHQGTLFIDEAGDIPMATQVKLLRVFQNKLFFRVGGTRSLHSDFRLVCATNKNLWHEVQAGRFREDLYYRISVIPLHVPPLRERQDDIMPLAVFFFEKFAKHYRRAIPPLNARHAEALRAYPWPGNIRELKSVIERAVILHRSGPLDLNLGNTATDAARDNLPPPAQTPASALYAELPTLDQLQADYISHVLRLTQGRIAGEKGALRILGLPRSTLYSMCKRHGLPRKSF